MNIFSAGSIELSIFTFAKITVARKQTYRIRYTNKLAEAGEKPEKPERKERVPVDPLIQQPYLDGKVLLINKPLHWTSFDVVRKLRSLLQIKKIGHAGTLDPLATGLLIVCTGKFTKKINEYMAQEKEYTGSITLGAVTPTYDLESEPQQQKDHSFLTEEMIRSATEKFIGEIDQYPPMFSAIKKDGVALYELARRGEEVELKARKIFIRSFEITSFELPVVHFKVVCSTGTYIRSLANDFGAALGCGAYLSSLCRTRIGEFKVDEGTTIEELEKSLNG
ncbi:MAG TPA: tRNA pseudouridine(55) synthase TruB [Ferruginibacter sp.]|nr:tRNA pseudouridine(55) synthase TruB [Ferruginibacter sp.]